MTHMKTGVTADYISDLHHWMKLYFNVHYLCIIAYITSDTEKSENSSHDRYRKSEHKETNAHWRSSSICSAKCSNVAYISESVNIVKISLLIVSRQKHSCWNRSRAAALNALDIPNVLSEKRFRRLSACGRELNESFKLIRKPIHWFAQAFEQNWLKRMNHSRMGIAHCPEKSRLRVWNKLKHFLLIAFKIK